MSHLTSGLSVNFLLIDIVPLWSCINPFKKARFAVTWPLNLCYRRAAFDAGNTRFLYL